MKEIPVLDVSCCIHLELLICWQDDGRVEITKEGHVNFFGVRLVQPVPVPESPHLHAGPEPCLQDL